MRDSEELIPVGKIIGTHGIKGQLKVHSYSGNFESLSAARSVVLKSAGGTLQELTLKSINANSGKFIIGFTDFDDIDQVKPLVGNELCLKRCQLPKLTDDEYYWSDLIGLQGVTHVISQRSRQTQPCCTPLFDTHRQYDSLPQTTDCD